MRAPRRAASIAAAAGILVALLAGVAGAAIEERTGVLRTSDRPEGRPLDVVRIDGVDYLDLQEMARLFRATKYWRAEIGKMVLKIGERRVTVTVGSPYVYVEAKGANLLAPVVWYDGRIFAPVSLATEVLDRLVPERVRWIPESAELRVVRGDPNVLGLRWDPRENGTLVTVHLGERLSATLAQEKGRAVVRVADGRLAESVPSRATGAGLVDSADVVEEPEGVVLTFHLARAAGPAELFARAAPPRLELIVPSAAAAAEEEIPLPAFEPAVTFAEPRPVRVVVLDPGHGGSDEGVTSAPGLSEKEVSLAIARKLRDLLVADGFQVLLTRDGDRFVSADARARVANGAPADVFVSLHANGWFDRDLEGFRVGIPSSPPGPPADPGEPWPWGQRDSTTVRDTETLAEIVASRLEAATGRPNRGVRADAYAPLAGVTMPAAMVECGFLTNEGDAKRLTEPAFRDKIAGGLAAALREYRDTLAAARPDSSVVLPQEGVGAGGGGETDMEGAP